MPLLSLSFTIKNDKEAELDYRQPSTCSTSTLLVTRALVSSIPRMKQMHGRSSVIRTPWPCTRTPTELSLSEPRPRLNWVVTGSTGEQVSAIPISAQTSTDLAFSHARYRRLLWYRPFRLRYRSRWWCRFPTTFPG